MIPSCSFSVDNPLLRNAILNPVRYRFRIFVQIHNNKDNRLHTYPAVAGHSLTPMNHVNEININDTVSMKSYKSLLRSLLSLKLEGIEKEVHASPEKEK